MLKASVKYMEVIELHRVKLFFRERKKVATQADEAQRGVVGSEMKKREEKLEKLSAIVDSGAFKANFFHCTPKDYCCVICKACKSFFFLPHIDYIIASLENPVREA